jgi:hypothetical protein
LPGRACYGTIEPVTDAGENQDDECPSVGLLGKEQPQEHRNSEQASEAHHVRNRPDAITR